MRKNGNKGPSFNIVLIIFFFLSEYFSDNLSYNFSYKLNNYRFSAATNHTSKTL